MLTKRLIQLQAIAQREGIAYFFLTPGANMTYFTGLNIKLSERPTLVIVPQQGKPWAYCPVFEALKIKKITGFDSYITYTDEEGPYVSIKRWTREMGLDPAVKIAFDYRSARLLEYDLVRQALPQCIVVDARPLMAELRRVKDEQEIEVMRYCAKLADDMMRVVRNTLAPGVSENRVWIAAQEALYKAEPEAHLSFFIAAGGPNSADPHADPSDRRMEFGDLVIVDLGVSYKGYISDITRTFPIGIISEEARHVYQVVQKANEAGRAFARPNVTCEAVDQVTRRVIEDAGYGKFFTHRTGHGLGLEEHEEPYIVKGNTYRLEAGVCITVEPGIYLPGRFGVRIEDDIVITADGSITLTSFPRYLIY